MPIGLSKSWIVREALAKYIAEESDHAGPSVYDQAKDLRHLPRAWGTFNEPEAYGRFGKDSFAKGGATMKTITIKVPESLEKKVVYEAQRQGISKSSLVREALASYLQTAEQKDSALDLIRDIVGSVDGPEDLSTNPEYLRDLGEDSVGNSRRK